MLGDDVSMEPTLLLCSSQNFGLLSVSMVSFCIEIGETSTPFSLTLILDCYDRFIPDVKSSPKFIEAFKPIPPEGDVPDL